MNLSSQDIPGHQNKLLRTPAWLWLLYSLSQNGFCQEIQMTLWGIYMSGLSWTIGYFVDTYAAGFLLNSSLQRF